jgi:cytochrome c biogenesis factor
MAVGLPVWVLVSRGIIADGIGAQLVIYLVLCPILFIALAVLVGLTAARKQVRETRTISWLDSAVLLVIWAATFTYGLFALPALAVLVVVSIVVGFWVVVWQLVTETRDRVKTFFEAGQVQGPRVIPDVRVYQVPVVPRDPLSR